ncbi:MAG: hypothetical protein HKL80_01385 [Acidimicrobiales bacterium]|nr:hypothetical protein [Acidimicrobiales bacterium]
MVLAYNTLRTTKDIDAIFEPKSIAFEIALEIANDSEIKLTDNWLNDAVKLFPFPGNQVDGVAKVLYENNGLTLRVASPKYLFAMKAWSGREVDEDDLRILWPLCEFNSASECLDYIEQACSLTIINPRIQYIVEEVAESFKFLES